MTTKTMKSGMPERIVHREACSSSDFLRSFTSFSVYKMLIWKMVSIEPCMDLFESKGILLTLESDESRTHIIVMNLEKCGNCIISLFNHRLLNLLRSDSTGRYFLKKFRFFGDSLLTSVPPPQRMAIFCKKNWVTFSRVVFRHNIYERML